MNGSQAKNFLELRREGSGNSRNSDGDDAPRLQIVQTENENRANIEDEHTKDGTKSFLEVQRLQGANQNRAFRVRTLEDDGFGKEAWTGDQACGNDGRRLYSKLHINWDSPKPETETTETRSSERSWNQYGNDCNDKMSIHFICRIRYLPYFHINIRICRI
jgi:hypothetical protein